MALSAVSNVPFSKNQVNQQKSETTTEQPTAKGPGFSAGKNIADNTFDDTVTLSQVAELSGSEKTADLSSAVDATTAEKLLPETMKAILAKSETALAAQANLNPQTAKEFLADK